MQVNSDTQISHSVLIVDDEPQQLSSLTELMELSGYKVTTADCGNRAIELLRTTTFDSLLLDLQMPNGTGFDVIDHVVNAEKNCVGCF